MRIGHRLFPYPVLNKDNSLNAYKNSSFELKVEIQGDSDKLLLKNIHYIMQNHNLENLIFDNKVEVVCVVECSATLFRKSFEINGEGTDIELDLRDLNGKVEISAFAYAKEDIPDFWDEDFVDEYYDISFPITKYDVLAVDDGITTKITFDEEQDTKISSIFLVTKDMSEETQTISVNPGTRKISITVPEKQFNFYDKTKFDDNFKNIFFSFLIIPALTHSLEEIKRDEYGFENARIDKDWFASVEKSYKEQTGETLDEETFQNESSVEIAQKVMGYPITNGFDEIRDLILGGQTDYDEDE